MTKKEYPFDKNIDIENEVEYEELIDCYVEENEVISTEKNKNIFAKILKGVISLSNIDVLWNIATHPKRAGKYFKPGEIALIIGAVIYTITPLDAIPDWLPGGFLDDIGVINFVLKRCNTLLYQYRNEFMVSKKIVQE